MTDRALGRLGEKAAVEFLKARGFKILENNYRTRFAEIDIIARDKERICFIEVKTRKNTRKGLGRESVNLIKQKKIILGSSFYLREKKLFNSRIRFDVVEVYDKRAGLEVKIIKNAFQDA